MIKIKACRARYNDFTANGLYGNMFTTAYIWRFTAMFW